MSADGQGDRSALRSSQAEAAIGSGDPSVNVPGGPTVSSRTAAVASALVALAAERAAAREEAALELYACGFVRAPDGESWTGVLTLPEHAGIVSVEVHAEVRLPVTFPDALPEVQVDRARLPRRIAHAEKNGKICIAPTSGVLLDAERPRELVREALTRAAREIARGIAGESDPDLQSEFLAYWEETDAYDTYCICSPDGPLRTVARVRVKGKGFLASEHVLIADSEAIAEAWAANVGATATPSDTVLFVPLHTTFAPPAFGESLTVKEVRALIAAHTDVVTAEACAHHLSVTSLPTTIVLSLPEGTQGAGRQLVAVRFERAKDKAAKAARNGFRPGHVPPWRELQFSGNEPVGRLSLERLDRAYLGARGGAADALADRVVAVVGVGAVGSEIAQTLAALGVGCLRLIDPDTISAENVHRHVLGIRDLQKKKAVALAADLASRLPHQSVVARPERIEDVLTNDGEFLLSADLIVLALGDETLERRLNRLLANGPPRLHVWVEPLGIAGHALLVVPGSIGCFECLLSLDPALGLYNRAAMTAPGQEIRRSLAGCAGTFSPFSALDARRTALEAADLGSRALVGGDVSSELVTWRGEHTEFEAAGYLLSRRAGTVAAGSRVRTTGVEFGRTDCSVCGRASFATVTEDEATC